MPAGSRRRQGEGWALAPLMGDSPKRKEDRGILLVQPLFVLSPREMYSVVLRRMAVQQSPFWIFGQATRTPKENHERGCFLFPPLVRNTRHVDRFRPLPILRHNSRR